MSVYDIDVSYHSSGDDANKFTVVSSMTIKEFVAALSSDAGLPIEKFTVTRGTNGLNGTVFSGNRLNSTATLADLGIVEDTYIVAKLIFPPRSGGRRRSRRRRGRRTSRRRRYSRK